MALFIAVNIYFLRGFSHDNTFELLHLVPLSHFFILGLAVYRGANILSNEFVTTPLRAYFVKDVETADGKTSEMPYETGLRGTLGSLLYCPSCTGVWIAMILTYSYVFWPGPASIVIFFLALSGLERFFAYAFGKLKRK